MRTWLLSAAALLSALTLPPPPAWAGTLAGVELPEAIEIDGETLRINGMGLREATFMRIRAYVGALYLETPTSDGDVVIRTPETKRVTMVFLRSISSSQLASGWADSLREAAPGQGPSIDRFMEIVPAVSNGDQMDFTWRPGKGVEIALNEKVQGTIAEDAFATALFTLWFGPEPGDPDLKKGMLGS